MLNSKDIQIILTFLQRTSLQGNEAVIMVQIMQKLTQMQMSVEGESKEAAMTKVAKELGEHLKKKR